MQSKKLKSGYQCMNDFGVYFMKKSCVLTQNSSCKYTDDVGLIQDD